MLGLGVVGGRDAGCQGHEAEPVLSSLEVPRGLVWFAVADTLILYNSSICQCPNTAADVFQYVLQNLGFLLFCAVEVQLSGRVLGTFNTLHHAESLQLVHLLKTSRRRERGFISVSFSHSQLCIKVALNYEFKLI